MGLCDKIFIINLQNLQMLFMSWIEHKYSECLAPCTHKKPPNGRFSGVGSAQAGRQGVNSGTIRSNLIFPPKFCSAQKNLFWTYDKNKNLSTLKMFWSSQTLKPAQGLVLTKLCLQLTYIFEGHSASRCSITSKTYFINHHYRDPVSILGVGSELG